MRYRSLTGPLILILVGIFFLARNVLPGWRLVGWLRDYWPVLLIAIGVLKLVERLAWSRASNGVNGEIWR